MQRRFCLPTIVWTAVVLIPAALQADGPADFMISTRIAGKIIEGQPLRWDQQDMHLLGRDGALYQFPYKSVKNALKIPRKFYSYTFSEMRNRLREEFGHRFEVSTTQHFIVVYPRGSDNAWAERMERLYRTFVVSMRVRGMRLSEPSTPMVAIVFRNRDDYYQHAAEQGESLPPGTLGTYNRDTNRVTLFDDSHSQRGLDTVIHEATHQSAFNVGVHRRFATQPVWLVEGLAMMYETPGMREAWSIHTRRERINHGRLNDFRYFLQQRPPDTLQRLIASEDLFSSNRTAAYAEAWMLSFYLFETQAHDYSRYLARVAARPAFSGYSARQRLVDFAHVFGSDFKQLNAQLLRFVESL